MKKLCLKDFENIIRGSSVLSTGGGGDSEIAKIKVKKLLKDGLELRLADINDLPENSFICTAFTVGSLESKSKSLPPITVMKKCLKKCFDKKIDAIVPVEIGPESIMDAIFLANSLKVPLLNADIVGKRSSPEIYLETITMGDIDRTPLIASNIYGDVSVLISSSSYMQTEKFLRNFAILSGGSAYVSGYPMTLSKIKKIVGLNTISMCIEIGRKLEDSYDPIKTITSLTDGYEIFRGEISEVEKKDSDGFLSGITKIRNKDSEFKIWFKNENIISWLNDRPAIMPPDLICLVDKNGYGLSNKNIKPGLDVVVLGIPALPIWKTKRGLSLFGPNAFGFNIKYRPMSYFIEYLKQVIN